MEAELNDLSSDIELKTKLIEQLELSQQRMQIMRHHYEEKLNVLNSKILNTQKERDQVLANMGIGGSGGNQSSDKIKKVRDEYERKIVEMQKQLRRLETAQKEHIRQQRELQSQEAQLKNLKNELFELKSAKVYNFFFFWSYLICFLKFNTVLILTNYLVQILDKTNAKNDR